jgi:WD40 repeat protein
MVFEQQCDPVKAMVFAKDASWLAMNTANEVIVVASDSGQELKRIPISDPLIAYATDSDELVVTSTHKGSSVTYYDCRNWQVALEHRTTTSPRASIAVTADGQRLALGLTDGRLEFWDIRRMNK